MGNLSLEMAYARYGAQVTNKHRNLSSVATDGSLVITCPAERFSRPGIGVLRYSSQISGETSVAARVTALRAHVSAAHEAQTDVRPVILSAAPAVSEKRPVHVRTDLVGKVVAFDGDHFVVDFTRLTPVEEPRINNKRRRGTTSSSKS
jgi:hypothetical protein